MSLEKSTGRLLWAVQLRLKKGDVESFWIGPLLSTNKLLIMSSSGTILSLSPYSGKTLSKIQFKESFIAGPFQVEEKIYLISEQGILFVLGLKIMNNVIILGKPNVGKSSLFNAIVMKELAVVSRSEKLTRDLKK